MWLKAGQSNMEVIPVLAVHFPLRVTASFLRAQRESALHQLSVVDDR
nr:MAG TPA: carbohydrate esterase [Caudoviricetes sp.]